MLCQKIDLRSKPTDRWFLNDRNRGLVEFYGLSTKSPIHNQNFMNNFYQRKVQQQFFKGNSVSFLFSTQLGIGVVLIPTSQMSVQKSVARDQNKICESFSNIFILKFEEVYGYC